MLIYYVCFLTLHSIFFFLVIEPSYAKYGFYQLWMKVTIPTENNKKMRECFFLHYHYQFLL